MPFVLRWLRRTVGFGDVSSGGRVMFCNGECISIGRSTEMMLGGG